MEDKSSRVLTVDRNRQSLGLVARGRGGNIKGTGFLVSKADYINGSERRKEEGRLVGGTRLARSGRMCGVVCSCIWKRMDWDPIGWAARQRSRYVTLVQSFFFLSLGDPANESTWPQRNMGGCEGMSPCFA